MSCKDYYIVRIHTELPKRQMKKFSDGIDVRPFYAYINEYLIFKWAFIKEETGKGPKTWMWEYFMDPMECAFEYIHDITGAIIITNDGRYADFCFPKTQKEMYDRFIFNLNNSKVKYHTVTKLLGFWLFEQRSFTWHRELSNQHTPERQTQFPFLKPQSIQE